MELDLIVYDGSNMTDDVFKWFWAKMVEDGSDKIVFHSGHITTEFEFLELMKRKVLPLMIVDRETRLPVGMSWLSDIEKRRAFGHFCMLSSVWGKVPEIGRTVLKFWIDNGFEILIGMLPSSNTYAINAMERAGMKIVGEVPYFADVHGKSETATIIYVSKEEF